MTPIEICAVTRLRTPASGKAGLQFLMPMARPPNRTGYVLYAALRSFAEVQALNIQQVTTYLEFYGEPLEALAAQEVATGAQDQSYALASRQWQLRFFWRGGETLIVACVSQSLLGDVIYACITYARLLHFNVIS
jgi:hypothetical protein